MNLLEVIEIYPKILKIDFLRYFIAASIAYLGFWILFKKYWRHRNIQQKDLQTKKMVMEFGYSMSTVVIFAFVGSCLVVLENAGYTLIYDEIGVYGWAWFFVSLILMILLHDAWFYWTHRLMHHPRIFRYRSFGPSPIYQSFSLGGLFVSSH